MIKTKQIVNGKWVYAWVAGTIQIGDRIEFTCNGAGRAGHYGVSAIVTKVNSKTLKANEEEYSYSPGTKWTIAKDQEICKVLPAILV